MTGYLLEVQADLLASLATTIVVPLIPQETAPKSMGRLHPVFEIGGASFVMATQLLASIPRKELGEPVGSLSEHRYYDVANALDMLLSGS